jgi:hypothetical protein
MLFKFLKTNFQFLETGVETPQSSSFLKLLLKKSVFIKKTQCNTNKAKRASRASAPHQSWRASTSPARQAHRTEQGNERHPRIPTYSPVATTGWMATRPS